MTEHVYKRIEWTDSLKSYYVSLVYTSVPFECDRCGTVVIRDRRTYTPQYPEIQDCDLAMIKVIHAS